MNSFWQRRGRDMATMTLLCVGVACAGYVAYTAYNHRITLSYACGWVAGASTPLKPISESNYCVSFRKTASDYGFNLGR